MDPVTLAFILLVAGGCTISYMGGGERYAETSADGRSTVEGNYHFNDDGSRTLEVDMECRSDQYVRDKVAEMLNLICAGHSYRIVSPVSYRCQNGSYERDITVRCE